MTETTPNHDLPLLAPAQAQKHVTVNEALSQLDALVDLTLRSMTETEPPAAPVEGAVWAVPAGATGAWTGRSGQLALALGGGWRFVAPGLGRTARLAANGARVCFDGAGWVPAPVAAAPSGAGLTFRAIEIDHEVAASATSTTAAVIPKSGLVFGVTGRVIAPVTGATAWTLGVPGAADRYGAGLGVSAGSWVRGVTGAPVAYYAATPLVLTAEGGAFAGGTLRLVVHVAELGLPAVPA